MAYDAGSVFVNLFFKEDGSGAATYEAKIKRLEARSKGAIEKTLKWKNDEASLARVEQQIKRLEDEKKTFIVEGKFDKASAAKVNKEIDAALDKKQNIEVRLDNHASRGLKSLQKDAENTRGSFRRLGSSMNLIPDNLFAIQTRIPLVGWGVMAAGISAVIPLVISLSSALGPIAGLLGALPGLVLTAGGAFATLALGLKGIGGALTTAWQAQNAAAATSAKSADRAADATKKVADAQRSLADAQRGAGRAQDDLNRAREDAVENIREMRIEVERAALAEKGARLTQTEAHQELGRVEGDSTSTSLELAQARLRVQEAEAGLEDTRRDNAQNAKDLRDAEKDGVQRAPQVVAARESLADAERSVADAARGVEAAHRDNARMNEALSASTDQLATKMADLSPAGRSFVNFMKNEMFPVVKNLQKTAQEGLLPGVEKGFKKAAENLPVLTKTVSAYSDALGDAAEKQGEFLGQKKTGQDMWLILKSGEGLIRKLSDALVIFEGGLLDVGVAARPLTNWLGDINVKLATMFAKWAESGRESGKLEQFFKRSAANTELFVSTLWNFTQGLINIGRIARRVWGQDMLGGITEASERFERWTESVRGAKDIENYFRRWRSNWHDISNAISGVITQFRQLRRSGKSVTEALIEIFAEGFAKAFVSVIAHIGESVDDILIAFGKAWVDSDIWGKIFLPAFLISKFGGLKAWGAVGAKVGVIFGLSFAPAAGSTAATGTMATILGPKMAARWAATGVAAARFFSIGLVAAIGIGVAQGLKKLKEDVIDPFMKDLLGDKAGGAISGIRDFIGKNIPNPITNQIFGRGSHDDKKDADEKKKGLKGIADAADSINGKGVRDLRRQLGFLDGDVKPARKAIDDVSDDARNKFAKAGDATDEWRHKIHIMVRDSQGKFADMKSNVQLNTKLINKALGDPAGRTALTVNMQEIVKVIRRTMSRGGEVTDKGLALIKKLYVNELKFYGLSPKEAIAGANLRTGDDVGGHRRGDEVGKNPDQYGATGGWAGVAGYYGGGRVIGKWGERGKDLVHAVLGRGEAVLNHPQQKLVNKALQIAGIRGGLPQIFKATKGSRHHMAGGGIVGIPGSPGMSIDRRILPDVLRLRSRYRARINAGYAPTGHKAAGEHPLGLAVDWVPGSGGSWNAIDSFAHWAEPSQNNPRPPFRWVGYDGDADHGRGDHLHTSWMHGPGFPAAWVKTLQGKVIGNTFGKIKRVMISGKDSPLKSSIQGVVDNARHAANKRITRKLSRSVFGGSFDHTAIGGNAAANRRLGKQMAESFGGWGHGAEWAALDHLWGVDESGWRTNADNPKSDAYGIPQALPGSKMASEGADWATNPATQIRWGLKYIRDRAGYGDPIAAHAFRHAHGWYEGGGFAGEGIPFAGGGYTDDYMQRVVEKGETMPILPAEAQSGGSKLLGVGKKATGRIARSVIGQLAGMLAPPGSVAAHHVSGVGPGIANFSVHGSPSASGKLRAAQDKNNLYGWITKMQAAEGGGFVGIPSLGGLAGGLQGLPFAPGVNSGPPPKNANKVIARLETDIGHLDDRYQLDSSWAALTDEDFINEGTDTTPPSLNQEAIEHRLGELNKLIATRDKITKKYQRLIRYVEKLIETYNKLRRRLKSTIDGIDTQLKNLSGRKGKEAKNAREGLNKRRNIAIGQIGSIDEELQKLVPKLSDARVDEESSRIDREGLEMEAAPLRGGGAGLTLPDWEPAGLNADQTAIADQQRQRADLATNLAGSLRSALQTFAGAGDLGRAGPTTLDAALRPTGVPGPGYVVGPSGELIPVVSGSGPTSLGSVGGISPSTAGSGSGGYNIIFQSTLPATRDQARQVGAWATEGIDSQALGISSRTRVDL